MAMEKTNEALERMRTLTRVCEELTKRTYEFFISEQAYSPERADAITANSISGIFAGVFNAVYEHDEEEDGAEA